MNWSDILLYESRSDKKNDILSEIIGHMLIDYSLIMINDDHKKQRKWNNGF